jgi:hypothetical protein
MQEGRDKLLGGFRAGIRGKKRCVWGKILKFWPEK